MKTIDAEIRSIDDAVDTVLNVLGEHPERDFVKARRAALEGEERGFPVLGINNLGDPEDLFEPMDKFELPKVVISNGLESELAEELINTLEPLKMLNPITVAFNLGMGTGTLVSCFGIPLDSDCGYAPAYSLSLDEAANSMPAPRKTGLMPEIREKIKAIKEFTPESIEPM